MTNITYNIELQPVESGDFVHVVKILEIQRNIVNRISQLIKENKMPLILKLLHDKCYYQIKSEFPEVPSQILIKCEQEVLANYKSMKTNKHKRTQIEKKNLSLRLDKRLYSGFTKTGIKLTVPGCNEDNKRTPFLFKLYPKVEEMFEKYAPCDPLLFIRDNRLFLSVTFNIPTQLPKDESTLGIDLGMRRLFVTSEGKALKSTEYLKHKRRIRYQKRMLQTKNTKSSKRKLRKKRRDEFNFSKNYIHHVANEILKTDKSIIVMEDLTKIKKKKNKFQNINAKSQIPFFMLREILTYKAPLVGKRVATVHPAYTSQDDSRGLSRGERKGCRYIATDGKILDADWNAAINISYKIGEHHPTSVDLPLAGQLNLVGRLLSTNQMQEAHVLASHYPSGCGS